MPLILAIEPDKRQSTQLASLVKGLQAELVQRPTAADALGALQGRVPDLVLTTSLLSPRDDMALAAHLRELGSAAAHVQTVTIPLLGSAAPKRAKGGMLAALRREKPQAPMTDGCDPDIFAEQVRQYLATAQEHKASAATRAADDVLTSAGPDPAAFESAEVEPAVFEPESLEAEGLEAEPVVEAAVEEPVEIAGIAEIEAAPAAPEIETSVEAVDEPALETVEEPEELVADEPAGLPLSQLLQLVSDAAPFVDAPVAEAPIFEALTFEVPATEPIAEPEPVIEAAEWQPEEPISEPVEEPTPEPVVDFGELYVDPMAAQALDELSRQAPTPSIADGIPAEAPVPVVEMHAFQSLDSIASELAAGPSPRHESLDDLASLFAAAPAPPKPALFAAAPAEPVVDFSAPRHGEKSLFASLFAEPALARPAEPIEVPGIDPSLFASATAAPATAVEEREPTIVFEQPEPILAAEAFEPILAVEEFQPLLAVEASEPLVAAEPGQVMVAEPEPVLAAVPEPVVFDVAPPAPAPQPEPEQVEEPIVVFEPVLEEPVAVAAAPVFEEEISLDVDAFAFTPAPAPVQPAEASRFSFTFVDGFGDAWSDFDVPTVAAVAAALGVGDHPPLDPYAARMSAPAVVSREATEPTAAPALDDEALSLIGDAARKVGLDALVIEEFERGLTTPRPKKAKKKVHVGATQVPAPPAAPAPKAAKRPVQDEWGMFDPEQCGFAALEDEEGAETRPVAGTRVRVVSY